MMEKQPLVSILIPTYNREKYISEAIESAINQSYSNLEIIIGDNRSSDNTWKIINEYASKDLRIKVFQNATNVGPVLNWWECIKRAKGEFIKIIWSDDYISLDYIEKSINVFDDDCAFVISNIHTVDEKSKEISVQNFKQRQYSIKEYLNDVFIFRSIGFPVSPGAAIFRTKDILNNFIVDIPNEDKLDSKKNGAGNDELLFLNTANLYKKINIIDAVSYFRFHRESFSYIDISLYYYWGKRYYLRKHKNKNYSNVLKYRTWIMYLKNKKYKLIYHSFNYNTYLPISMIYIFIFYVRKYVGKYFKFV